MKELVVITGASSGIGEELAKQMNALGHPLLLLARRVEKLEALGLSNTLCLKVDVTIKKRSKMRLTSLLRNMVLLICW